MNEGNSGVPVNTDNSMENELAAMETRMTENLTKNLKKCNQRGDERNQGYKCPNGHKHE